MTKVFDLGELSTCTYADYDTILSLLVFKAKFLLRVVTGDFRGVVVEFWKVHFMWYLLSICEFQVL